MESLSGILAFVHAARLRSYVAAGAQLGISASAVGKSVARLEDGLGVRLLNRSTRRISLTEEGELFLERCARIVRELEEAEAEVTRGRQSPRGRLRVSLPAIGYRMLVPLLPEFTRRYPEIELDLDFSDRIVDLIGEGVDVAMRSGSFADSRLKARPLGAYRFAVVASPAYLAARGAPLKPVDLGEHARLAFRHAGDGQLQEWRFGGAQEDAAPPLRAALAFNNVEALVGAAEAGLGLAYVPDFAVRQLLHDGKLVETLADWAEEGGRFSLLWPATRHALPKLRVFVDFLAERLQQG
jgi:DNA-binding transcriptional LysR family regulator